jgi:rhamnosyl/mannosyltransferase
MQDLLDRPDRAREMGLAARRRFEELFTADAMAQRYEALYRELAAARR